MSAEWVSFPYDYDYCDFCGVQAVYEDECLSCGEEQVNQLGYEPSGSQKEMNHLVAPSMAKPHPGWCCPDCRCVFGDLFDYRCHRAYGCEWEGV